MKEVLRAAIGNGKLDKTSIEYRREVLEIIRSAGRGHLGPTFSAIEIIRVLYEKILRGDPDEPTWADRDRFILSKGHGCLALYVALARLGYFGKDELKSFCRFGSRLGGHPEYLKLPGVEASTGALGHGLSLGIGVALSARLDGRVYRTFVLLGDGECNEGAVWEAAMSASKHKLSNLIAIVDYNKMQCYGQVSEVMPLEPFADKWRSFGFAVREVDGHNVGALQKTFEEIPFGLERPGVVICHTVKGKGIASIEGDPSWHHKIRLADELLNSLIAELGVV
jgi:transketolase